MTSSCFQVVYGITAVRDDQTRERERSRTSSPTPRRRSPTSVTFLSPKITHNSCPMRISWYISKTTHATLNYIIIYASTRVFSMYGLQRITLQQADGTWKSDPKTKKWRTSLTRCLCVRGRQQSRSFLIFPVEKHLKESRCIWSTTGYRLYSPVNGCS